MNKAEGRYKPRGQRKRNPGGKALQLIQMSRSLFFPPTSGNRQSLSGWRRPATSLKQKEFWWLLGNGLASSLHSEVDWPETTGSNHHSH